jgi:DNA gyrase subunit A
MNIERPDLNEVDPGVRAYIEALEAEIERLRESEVAPEVNEPAEVSFEPSEPPTTINLITISAGGHAKRTPRHLYSRQRRGGMGIFDLEAPEDDRPAFLTLADESHTLILITSLARTFRVRVRDLAEAPVRSRGQSITASLPFQRDERLAAVLPVRDSGYLAVLSWRGYVRGLRYNFVGATMTPGTVLYDVREFGTPVAASWTTGDSDLFIATRRGNAIRFNEKSMPVAGCQGMRLESEDAAVVIAAVQPDSGVFLLGADGKGTIRLMPGFNPNKAPGAGGKLAMKTDRLIGAVTVGQADDIFILSRLGKIIRFRVSEVPAKEGVVQGVNCMALRGDDTVTVVNSPTT